MAKGKRLTCPICKDSSFVFLEQLEASGGRVRCQNHPFPVDMVDLVALYEVLAAGVAFEEETEELRVAVDSGLIHPQDFEFEEVSFE